MPPLGRLSRGQLLKKQLMNGWTPVPEWKNYHGYNLLVGNLFTNPPTFLTTTNRPPQDCETAPVYQIPEHQVRVFANGAVFQPETGGPKVIAIIIFSLLTHSLIFFFCCCFACLMNEKNLKVKWLRENVEKVIQSLPVKELKSEDELDAFVESLREKISEVMSYNHPFPKHEIPPFHNFKDGVYTSERELEHCQQVFVTGLDTWATICQTVVVLARKSPSEQEDRTLYYFERATLPQVQPWTKFKLPISLKK